LIKNDDFALARAGDRDALNRVLCAAEERLRSIASARLGADLNAKIDTSDVLQSTYLDVVGSLDGFQGEDLDQFVTWVGRIIENNIRDRKRFFDAKKRRDPAAGTPVGGSLTERLGIVRSPSSQVAFTEDLFLLARALENLAAEHREVVILRKIRELEYDEIAEKMGRNEATTRRLFSRAMAALALEMDRLEAGPKAPQKKSEDPVRNRPDPRLRP
jgi:RNA polymerase sigma-70 factor (ECF subfamily)